MVRQNRIPPQPVWIRMYREKSNFRNIWRKKQTGAHARLGTTRDRWAIPFYIDGKTRKCKPQIKVEHTKTVVDHHLLHPSYGWVHGPAYTPRANARARRIAAYMCARSPLRISKNPANVCAENPRTPKRSSLVDYLFGFPASFLQFDSLLHVALDVRRGCSAVSHGNTSRHVLPGGRLKNDA